MRALLALRRAACRAPPRGVRRDVAGEGLGRRVRGSRDSSVYLHTLESVGRRGGQGVTGRLAAEARSWVTLGCGVRAVCAFACACVNARGEAAARWRRGQRHMEVASERRAGGGGGECGERWGSRTRTGGLSHVVPCAQVDTSESMDEIMDRRERDREKERDERARD